MSGYSRDLVVIRIGNKYLGSICDIIEGYFNEEACKYIKSYIGTN